ncbi:YceG family protein [Bacillus massiliigorillae]|uniref:YceG family protein n=1 Tax=Bacillus massiliigorillae TaxID=1243664 RepID=UPI0003A39D80|nr:YceG family protein [Bacillus massiliigorillae]
MKNIKIDPILYTSTDHWLNTFLASAKERPIYNKDTNVFTFQRIGLQVLGIPLDEDDYYNSLFEMHQKDYIYVLSEDLDKTINQGVFKSIQEILELHQQQPKGLSINRLIAFMYGKNLIPKYKDTTLNHHIQQTVIKVVEYFQSQHNTGLQSPEFRRFLIDMVKWMQNHLAKWMANSKFDDDYPKVVWYGNLTESQKYFLILLMEFGCDVLIFHPSGVDQFADIDPTNRYSIVYNYSNTGELEPFPTQMRERQTTVAYRANKQLEKMMNDQHSGVFKPWQFRNHSPTSITMKMTYDDIFIYEKEKAMIRPDFKVDQGKVYIPVIFAKIQGVSKDRKEYWERMRELSDNALTLTIHQFPFSQITKANYHYHFQHSLNKGKLSPEKMIKGSWWQYGHLPNELQLAIAHTIKEYCEQPKLRKLEQESDYDLQLFLFKQASRIPEVILQLLQKYDYAQDIPKLLLYHMETNGDLSREDAALLLFLNEFGLDLILYNPAGHNDIENYIDTNYYDSHWLEEVVFNQEFEGFTKKKGSLISKLINRIF